VLVLFVVVMTRTSATSVNSARHLLFVEVDHLKMGGQLQLKTGGQLRLQMGGQLQIKSAMIDLRKLMELVKSGKLSIEDFVVCSSYSRFFLKLR
jgi:hypothetical protein